MESRYFCSSTTELKCKLVIEKDHTDDLRLTCQKRNSSLGDKFLDALLRRNIEKSGTLGDWLRKDIESIRNSSIF